MSIEKARSRAAQATRRIVLREPLAQSYGRIYAICHPVRLRRIRWHAMVSLIATVLACELILRPAQDDIDLCFPKFRKPNPTAQTQSAHRDDALASMRPCWAAAA